ncbi:11897_t:CDS:2, partial [Racocetra fulgida]
NPEIKELFEFLYPLIKLPSRQDLGGRILAESAYKITKSIKNLAQQDKNAENISGECTKWLNVQYRTEKILDDLKNKEIKVNAVIIDCGSKYEAASHYLCFASIIKTRAALKNLATKIEEGVDENFKDFPEDIFLNISNN